MNFLKKIQEQPESVRKLILWVAVVIVGIGLMIFWLWISSGEIKRFSKAKFIEKLNLKPIREKTGDIYQSVAPLKEDLKKNIKIGQEKTNPALQSDSASDITP